MNERTLAMASEGMLKQGNDASGGRDDESTRNPFDGSVPDRSRLRSQVSLRFLSVLLVGLASSLLLAGCNSGKTVDLKMETLFNLTLGKAENQLDLLELPGVPTTRKTRIFMRDGLFYVGNGNADKVMEFSSYGDILSLIYNPVTNPEPLFLQSNPSHDTISTKEAHPYPLRNVGEIAVTQGKVLLVEDQVPVERQEFDKKLNAMLDSVVLRFRDNGSLIDYIGQEGVGGSPFPYIERIQSNSRGEIVVICRTDTEWLVFWYSRSGALMYKVEIGVDKLPLPAARGYVASLETIFADPDTHVLYLKIDYYSRDKTGGIRGDVDFNKSSVYWLDVDTRKYAGHVDLPRQVVEEGSNGVPGGKKVEILYELIGVAHGGYMFFLSPLQNNYYELLVLGKNGAVVRRSRIVLDDKKIAFRTFYLDPSGLLTALLVRNYGASVVWWRSDKLIDGLPK